MTLADEMKPKKNEIVEIKKDKKAVVVKKKQTKVETELKQVQKCLKDKDERIESLEKANTNAEEKTTWYVRSFNFLSLLAFIGVLSVLIFVLSLKYPEWFAVNMIHFAIIGTIACVSNFLASTFAMIFKTEHESDSVFFVIFNGFLIPCIAVVYTFILSISWR